MRFILVLTGLLLISLPAYADQQQVIPVGSHLAEKAAQGDVQAQCTLGVMYEFGQGGKVDWSEAYFWLSLCTQKIKDEYPESMKSEAEKHLTPDEKSAVEKRVQEWKPVAAPGKNK